MKYFKIYLDTFIRRMALSYFVVFGLDTFFRWELPGYFYAYLAFVVFVTSIDNVLIALPKDE